ncbi:MAG TPA: UvrD-helicase domain-containing protein, partial [Xanthobacteraceae bacterium]|nr:UvrD-helicase domain-containing protein [Xanthobacteraceae bacterium]
MPAAYLDILNPDQRRAVEHGIDGAAPAGQPPRPVLVIAGAGSGKTTTLAHRVAHLIVNGANPQRILLLTFSRRAASMMAHRVERIVAAAAPTGRHRLAWSGTFHA